MAKKKVPTQRERRDKLIEQLKPTVYARRVWQEQPWTFIKFRVKIPYGGSKTMETFGFSKVCHPDEWKEERGIELAEIRAFKKAVCEIMSIWDAPK